MLSGTAKSVVHEDGRGDHSAGEAHARPTLGIWGRDESIRVRRSLDTESVKTLVHAFVVTSHVDYCNSFLSSAPKKIIYKLQHVQNAAARLVTGTRKY